MVDCVEDSSVRVGRAKWSRAGALHGFLTLSMHLLEVAVHVLPRVRLKLKWSGHFVRTLLILPLGAEPEAEDLDLVHCLVIELVWSIVPGRSEHGGNCGLVAVHSLLNMC